MAWRLRLAPEKTNFDFFKHQWLTFGGSVVLMLLAFVAWGFMGLNFGIDFKGGTTLRTESVNAVDVGAYRKALEGLPIGDAAITEVFDTNFSPDQHVAMVRVSSAEKDEAIAPEALIAVKEALVKADPQLRV
ncbi:MAG: protein translocase subunit SecF, partial [Tabrizicola sp.]